MKILQLVTKRQYRGAEVFAANLSAELIDLGHNLIFAGLYANDQDILFVEKADNRDLIEEKKGAFSIEVVRRLIILVKETKPDVIQCNGSDTLKYMVAASFFVPNIPILYRNISMISQWVKGRQKKVLYKALFKRIAHVTSVGNEALADFVRFFDYPEEQTSVIRRGIPLEEFNKEEAQSSLKKELKLNSEDFIVLHVGNFSLEKNHLFLVRVFASIRKKYPAIKLAFIGNGATFNEVKQEVSKRKLEATVFFLGFRQDIHKLLAGADMLVLSSRVEGVPGVILEAAAQKKPSVSTDVGGVREVLIHGKTGFIIQDFNEKEFENSIIELATNNQLRQKMGNESYNLVYQYFNPVRNAKKFESLYMKLSRRK